MIKDILELTEDVYQQVIEIRRHLHQNPELSFQEKKTSQYVGDQLDKWIIPFQNNIGGFGISGSIGERVEGEKTIALRADMDALPIQEENRVPYASRIPGVMHACGHDVHTASLLGTSFVLRQMKEKLNGQVRLIFQPGEERLPGGACYMIQDGVLKNPTPAAILGQHVHPPLKVGEVGFRSGKYMASVDEIFITLRGPGGHGAMPHLSVDLNLLAAHLIIQLQQMISRRSNPIVPSVITIGKMKSEGGATNVLPAKVHLEGTFRTMDEKWRKEAHQIMKDMVWHMAQLMGAEAEIEIKIGYPYLYNDPELTGKVREAAIQFLGKDKVKELPVRMTSEDFSYYSHEVSACFYRVGIQSPRMGKRELHTPTFDVDERCFRTSVGLMAYLAMFLLKE